MAIDARDLPPHVRAALGCATPTRPPRRPRGTGKVGAAKREACAAKVSAKIAVGAMSFWVPVRTVSEMNQREHWTARHRRKVAQQAAVIAYLHPSKPLLKFVGPRVAVTLTRFGVRRLDPDNLAASFKHVQDAVAGVLGVDDGSDRVTWEYRQERAKEYGVRINVAAAAPLPAGIGGGATRT